VTAGLISVDFVRPGPYRCSRDGRSNGAPHSMLVRRSEAMIRMAVTFRPRPRG
jgi:hypothetical protein